MPSIGVSDINNFIDLYDEKTCGKHSWGEHSKEKTSIFIITVLYYARKTLDLCLAVKAMFVQQLGITGH
jgi:hypothetical protein